QVIDIEPNGALNLVITNTRISDNGAAVLLKPASGGSVTAVFDRVSIVHNSGSGLRSDSANGTITLDMSNSTVSENSANGVNIASGLVNMVAIKNSVFATNGLAGVQANGANSAAIIGTTLFDTNGSGALASPGGGHLLTYDNNNIIGSSGSGFNGTAPPQ